MLSLPFRSVCRIPSRINSATKPALYTTSPNIVKDIKSHPTDMHNVLQAFTKTHNVLHAFTKAPQLNIITSDSTDPFFNMAYEEILIEEHSRLYQDVNNHQMKTLFMWRTRPSVWIGVKQNQNTECNLDLMKKDGITLVRRPSGGGAVYRDLGDSSFSMLTAACRLSEAPVVNSDVGSTFQSKNVLSTFPKSCNRILLDTLRQLGVNATIKGTNNIVTQDSKKFKNPLCTSEEISSIRDVEVSASVSRLTRDVFVHHGTMLRNVNLDNLAKYLRINSNPGGVKLASKGLGSVKSRVANISELVGRKISHDTWVSVLSDKFIKHHPNHEVLRFDTKKPEGLLRKQFDKIYDKYSSKRWTYSYTPELAHKFETRIEGFGNISIHMNDTKFVVVDIKIYSDSLYPNVISDLESALLGKWFDNSAVDNIYLLAQRYREEDEPFLADSMIKLANEMIKQKVFDVFNKY